MNRMISFGWPLREQSETSGGRPAAASFAAIGFMSGAEPPSAHRRVI